MAGIGKYSSLLKANAPLKNSATQVRRCFILATGPSIQQQDLSSLQGEFCISVSNFFVHPLFKKLDPQFHIFAPTHPPITEEQIGLWWKDATEFMTGNTRTKVFLHATNKPEKEKFGVFSGQQVHYYYGGGRFPVDFTKQVPGIQTVVHLAIYLAMYLGIGEIYLLGCDHSWLNHYGKSMHFYQEEQHAFTRNNYSEWSEVKDIGEEFKNHANLWDIYRRIRTEAIKDNIRIYNATPGSLLDIFPRKELIQVLNTSTVND
jgi:hypothetical protein